MFFISDKTDNIKEDLIKVCALLILAAKIDEHYTDKERTIIKNTLKKLDSNNEDINKLILEAEKNEENTNQILSFTKKIKESDYKFKSKVIEALWRVIYSNNEEDMYESNLMRRLSGLLYLDKKSLVDIKEKVKKELGK